MVSSYNGFKASPRPSDFGGLDNSVVPSTNGVKLAPGVRAGSVATIAHWTAWQWNTRIERLITPGCWGFNFRTNRNANNLSNHSSGTAWDLNAPQHPNGRRGTLNGPALEAGKTKLQVLREMLAYLEGTIRSGVDYTGTPDEMHLEVMDRVTLEQLDRVAAKIERDYGPRENWSRTAPNPIHVYPVVSPIFTDKPVASKWTKIEMGQVTVLHSSGAQVARDQAQLIDSGFPVGPSGADGFAGDDTISAIKAAQHALNLKVDGEMGPATRGGLNKVPSYGLPAGHVYGDIKGPVHYHGGINAWERAQVKKLQGQLIRHGVTGLSTRNPDGTGWDDGKYERATVSAVSRFQSATGLAVDGVVGPVTWNRLWA